MLFSEEKWLFSESFKNIFRTNKIVMYVLKFHLKCISFEIISTLKKNNILTHTTTTNLKIFLKSVELQLLLFFI